MHQDNNAIDLLAKVFKNQITDSELNEVPGLEQGECILSISGNENIRFKIDLSDDDNELFAGGA